MIEYADTSFLFSLYVRDANSARAVACYPDLAMPMPMTALHRVELQNANLPVVKEGEGDRRGSCRISAN